MGEWLVYENENKAIKEFNSFIFQTKIAHAQLFSFGYDFIYRCMQNYCSKRYFLDAPSIVWTLNLSHNTLT